MIIYNEEKKIFTINTENSTYQMMVDKYGYLLHLYYGNKSQGEMDYLLTYQDRGFSGNPYDAGRDRTYSLDFLPQEFPVQGDGDYRSPLLRVRNCKGVFGCDLRFKSHKITEEKYSLQGLPAVYIGKENVENSATLEITLEDESLGLKVKLLYGVLPCKDIITRSAVIINQGKGKIKITKAQTACLDFVNGKYDITVFKGRHTMERIPYRSSVTAGRTVIGSRRGTSSHQYNPFFVLSDTNTDEDSGRCYGMMLVYSGNFRGEVERDQYGQTRIQLGMGEEQLSYPLNPGENLTLPEVIMSFSDKGFAKLSHSYHRCIRENICRGDFKLRERSVLINSWETSYFNISGESIYKLAKNSKELGIEMVVMDDGWFGNRDDDYSGLGDWSVNVSKLGISLGELTERVNSLGMKFGIWMEPEMVSEDSRLYREHPEWAFVIPGKKPVRARHQLVLDFSREDVREYIFNEICSVLEQGNIEYLKWDCNRSLADIYSHSSESQGRVMHDYVLGLYEVLEKLNKKYPKLLIESCSGGGGRFDAGMLYYTPQIWCSDNTDPIDRLEIQYGTSFGYPNSVVGTHISNSPNEQTGRRTPLKTRGIVAMAGTFGYELDPDKLTAEEKAEVKNQIEFWKSYSELVENSTFYRLAGPLEHKIAAWEFISKDGDTALISAVVMKVHGNMPAQYVIPKGLQEDAFYTIREVNFDVFNVGENKEKCLESSASIKKYPGAALMDMGFPICDSLREYGSFLFIIEKILC